MHGSRLIAHPHLHERLIAVAAILLATAAGSAAAGPGTVDPSGPSGSPGLILDRTSPASGAAASTHDSLPTAPSAPPGRRVAPDLGAQPQFAGPVDSTDDLPAYGDRRLVTPPSPHLPLPTSGEFTSTVAPVPVDVLARSTWKPECPVTPEDLRYVTVTHVGFDGFAHTGELLVHRSVAEEFVEVFRQLYDARYPIERMWVTSQAELEERAWTHGLDNNTGAFVCRGSVGSDDWSEHARGLAVDINPFHNPYVKGDRVIPPHAVSYLLRDHRPGIIHDDDVVVRAFAGIGWTWGGNWSSSLDFMHFSHNDH